METKMRASDQHTKLRVRLIGISITLALGSATATALNGDIRATKCTSCTVASDFVTYAVNLAVGNARPGTYMVSSDVEARTAYVVVTGTLRQRCTTYEPCYWILKDASGVVVDDAGVANSQESVLEENDMKLFGTNRKAPIAPINVPPEYGGSYINNVALLEDTNTAIAHVLYTQRAIPAFSSSVKVGTIVTVVWPDGTSAKFKRVTAFGSYQWVYVPGTARDKNGKKIDEHGNIIGNQNTGGRGEGSMSFGGGAGWGFNASGQDRCMATTTVHLNGIFQGSYTQFLPC